MKKTTRILWMMVMLLSFSIQPSNAQFGNILKKAKKVLSGETENNSNQTQSTEGQVTATFIPIASGGSMSNPFAEDVNVELLGCYGIDNPDSQNYGHVYLVLKVKLLKPIDNSILLGGEVLNKKTCAIDQEGNIYYHDYPSVGEKYDVMEGVAVKIKMKDLAFLNVKKTTKILQSIRLTTRVGSIRESIEFRDVPILWNVVPEE
ncbi:hypothetical protein [uncultured Bacteroides sp.]|uniref:hypothetical protein n=1 Tax=uncultured Bacteroides sp. TaxID=162156 RepID=UPI0026093F31|nr:hypothetical protein [uncultured Bacteroides sp.]